MSDRSMIDSLTPAMRTALVVMLVRRERQDATGPDDRPLRDVKTSNRTTRHTVNAATVRALAKRGLATQNFWEQTARLTDEGIALARTGARDE